MSSRLPPATVVIPCLNEARSIPLVIESLEHIRSLFHELEILVVDNGSSDLTAHQASVLGARVVHCETRGYGAALRYGIESASHEMIAIADGDATYDFTEVISLFDILASGKADLVLGNRLAGKIQPNAMPFLNRYFGTPFLSHLLTQIFGRRRGIRVRDCNSGMRVFRKADFLKWKIESVGMEFASEMIARALSCRARYQESPISYRASLPGRRPHLRRWVDGVRHIWTIFQTFLTAPSRFETD